MPKRFTSQKQEFTKGIRDCLQLKRILSDGIDNLCNQWLQQIDQLDAPNTTDNTAITTSPAEFQEFKIALLAQFTKLQQQQQPQKLEHIIKGRRGRKPASTTSNPVAVADTTASLQKFPEFKNTEVTDEKAECHLCRKKADKSLLGPLVLIQFQLETFPIHTACAFWTKGIFYSEKSKYIYLMNKKSLLKAENERCSICNCNGATIRCQKCLINIVHLPCMLGSPNYSKTGNLLSPVGINVQRLNYRCGCSKSTKVQQQQLHVTRSRSRGNVPLPANSE